MFYFKKILEFTGLSLKMMGAIERTGVIHSIFLLMIITDKNSSFTNAEERISNQYKGIANLDLYLTKNIFDPLKRGSGG